MKPNTLIKSPIDGNWYYEETQWKYILDYLCDALDSFSEADMVCPERIAIDHIADLVQKRIHK